jgi:Serine carboxypeptidase
MKAGYHEKFTGTKHGIDFVTFNGAGHMVPQYKPKEALALITRWLAGDSLRDAPARRRRQKRRRATGARGAATLRVNDQADEEAVGTLILADRVARTLLPRGLHRGT